MPVLFAPEEAPDANHPVFKSNIAIRNESADGTEVYPFVYLRVNFSFSPCFLGIGFSVSLTPDSVREQAFKPAYATHWCNKA